ncbi:hypothetical protein ACRN9Z_16365 [Shewanella frigidimarina]|uniref:hypothetical protein n=1 Tax=Shewanella frigidimarina TaxID=56812 RepID=UPI003D799227
MTKLKNLTGQKTKMSANTKSAEDKVRTQHSFRLEQTVKLTPLASTVRTAVTSRSAYSSVEQNNPAASNLVESHRNVALRPRRLNQNLLDLYKAEIDNLEKENRYLKAKIEKLNKRLEPYERDMSELEQINDIKKAYLENMVQSSVLGEKLNCTRQNINRLRREHKLIAVNGKNGNYFPTWQIDQSGHLYGFIDKVISTIGADNQWTQIQFFHTPSSLLDEMSPINYLAKNDANYDLVVKAAEHYNEQSY